MKISWTVSNKSNFSSLAATVLLWLLVFVIFWNKTFTGAGLSENENVLSLNMELVRGEEGKTENVEKLEDNKKIEEVKNIDSAELPKTETIPEKQPEPVEKTEPVKQPEPVTKTEPKPELVKKSEPVPEPEKTTEPIPKKEWKLAKSVDDSLGDLWSSDFESVTESTEGIFDDNTGTKTGNVNADKDNNGASNSASGNNGDNINISLKEVKDRKLVNQEKPVIRLSKNASTILTEYKEVSLYFLITADGTVQNVDFKPANTLPVSIMHEIRDTVLTWKYEKGISQSVSFEVKIFPKDDL